ncbi:PLC-like phosphodiesterase [Fusarium acutatum]|uniref:PLC-like phosphodiesterase n=1 Tax=Fusarium acutatum TaxID=78861 RepID=A0A8H4JTF3_9HYPO|nr:PLC-like phosphodiesterase [Fusarium acutatum]
MTWADDVLEQIIPTTAAAAPWSEAKPIQPDPDNYGTDLKPAMCEFRGQVFLTWASAPSPMPASFSYTTWLPSDDGWASASWEYLDNNVSDAGCAIYSYDGTSFNFVCDWDSRWNDDHFVWAYSETGTTTITGPTGFSVNKIDQQSSSNPALLLLEATLDMGSPPTWSDTVTLNESGNSGISATSSPTGHHAWICFKTHGGLDAGIRYFDLRAGYQDAEDINEGPTLPLVALHGNWDLGLEIEEIFSFFYDWLDKHPSEGIIAQIKAEGTGVNSQSVSNGTNDLINEKPQYWALGDSIPTLNQIKGKVQLVRRFPRANAYDNTLTPFGIDVTNWPDDNQTKIESTPLNTSSPKVEIWLEDNYTPSSDGATALKGKTGFIKEFVSRAVSSNEPLAIPTSPMTWYIGFSSYTTSGGMPDSNFNYATKSLGGQTPMNKALEILIKSQGGYNNPKVVGTLVMDYPNWKSGTLIESIIYTNKLTLNH